MSAEESAEKIYGFLSSALSQNAAQRQQAERALREAEEHQDFFASMAVIAAASDDQADRNVRWLAAIQGKNAVSRSWRRRARLNEVSEDERDYVRQLLLSKLGERDTNIATQLSVWISLVARIDFPKHWPSIIVDLCDAIRSQDQRVMLHALITLDMVLKQLASRRLFSDRKSLYQVSPTVFSLLYDHFNTHLQLLLQNQAAGDAVQYSFLVVERCMKSFRRILSYGCEQLGHVPAAATLFSKLMELPDVFLTGAKGGNEMQIRLGLLTAKLVRDTHAKHPVEFQIFLSAFLEVFSKVVVEFDSKVSPDRTCFHGAAFLRNALECAAYKITTTATEEFKRQRSAGESPSGEASPEGCRFIVLSFFDENRVDTLIEAIISRIFVLNQTELDSWANDPEALVREEEVGEWGTENLRHECEELFKILLIREKRRVVPMVLRLTESVSADQPLLLDACYRAVGRAVYDVQGAFDFDVWLNGHLGKILQADCGQNLGDRVIQARTAWLVGQFSEQMTRDSRQIVNPLLVKLMSSAQGDRVVALTAAKAVQTLVEDLGFHPGDFSPYLETCLLACFRLVRTAETVETKRSILDTAISLVQRFPSREIVPLIDHVAGALPALWEEEKQPFQNAQIGTSSTAGNGVALGAGDENLLRTSIVTLLSNVVRKAGPSAAHSENLRKVFIPVIEFAVDLSKDKGGTFMMDEGCELWAAVVASSTEYTADLARLFPRTTLILGVDFDNLREVFNIMEGYCMLGRERFLHEHGQGMLQVLESALDSVKDRGCLAACEILDCLLQLFPSESVQFMSKVLHVCLMKVAERNQSHVLVAAYIALLARACLANIGDVERLILRGNEMATVELIDAIVENLDVIFRLPRRKMAVLALLGLTKRYCASAQVQHRIPLVLNAAVQVLAEEQRKVAEGHTGGGSDFANMLARFGEQASGMSEGERHLSEDPPSPEEERKRLLRERDMVHQLQLRNVCADLLATLKANAENEYQAILQRTDGNVIQKLELLLQK